MAYLRTIITLAGGSFTPDVKEFIVPGSSSIEVASFQTNPAAGASDMLLTIELGKGNPPTYEDFAPGIVLTVHAVPVDVINNAPTVMYSKQRAFDTLRITHGVRSSALVTTTIEIAGPDDIGPTYVEAFADQRR